MASVNKVILIGNAGKDPETRTFPNGDRVTNVTIATTEKWKDKQSGEVKEATEWHRLVFNGRLAEIAAEYIRKGSPVYVEGGLRTRKYNDTQGVEKYVVEIRVNELKLLGSKPQGDQGGDRGGYDSAPARAPAPRPQQSRAPAPASRNSGFDDMDDDIPF